MTNFIDIYKKITSTNSFLETLKESVAWLWDMLLEDTQLKFAVAKTFTWLAALEHGHSHSTHWYWPFSNLFHIYDMLHRTAQPHPCSIEALTDQQISSSENNQKMVTYKTTLNQTYHCPDPFKWEFYDNTNQWLHMHWLHTKSQTKYDVLIF